MKTFTDIPRGFEPEIQLGKKPGKGICLTFSFHNHLDKGEAAAYAHAVFKEIIGNIVGWLTWHSTESRSPLYQDLRAGNFFIQSRTDDFLMLEFWADSRYPERVHNFVNLLRGKFEFNFEPVGL